eukprot:352584-Pleurochrysis_carterae.AAC.2
MSSRAKSISKLEFYYALDESRVERRRNIQATNRLVVPGRGARRPAGGGGGAPGHAAAARP